MEEKDEQWEPSLPSLPLFPCNQNCPHGSGYQEIKNNEKACIEFYLQQAYQRDKKNMSNVLLTVHYIQKVHNCLRLNLYHQEIKKRRPSFPHGKSIEKLLFHGTSQENIPSILEQGMQFRPPRNGRRYGEGFYFTSSINMASYFCNITPQKPYLYILFASVLVGNIFANSEYKILPEGYDSFYDTANTYVVYNPQQIYVNYILVCKSPFYVKPHPFVSMKRYICKSCGKEYTREGWYNKHVQTHQKK